MPEKSINILIVDDDALSGKGLAKRLEKRGFTCSILPDGEDCVEQIFTSGIGEVDIILMDIMMPKMNGDEALEKIRSEYTSFQIPVIMLTSKTEDDEVVRLLNLGANDYLTKPVNIDVAIARIATQTQIVKMAKDSLKNKELETINSMVTTLNHEINNPLAIAVGQLSLGFERLSQERVEKVMKALQRITEIIKKVDQITDGSRDLKEINYSTTSNMYDLHTEKGKLKDQE